MSIFKISGESLNPAFRDGEFVVASRIPLLLRKVRKGDAVVFQKRDYGLMIKLVERLDQRGRLYVRGVHKNSIDYHKLGAISYADLVGVVILRIPKTSRKTRHTNSLAIRQT